MVFSAEALKPIYGGTGPKWAEIATYSATIYGDKPRKRRVLAIYGVWPKNTRKCAKRM